jgi:hypothetical protein
VDLVDQPIGTARLDVGDEDVGLVGDRLVGLLHHSAHPLQLAQERSELVGLVVGDGGAEPQHPPILTRSRRRA